MALNVTTAVFGENCNTATASPSLAQWDTEQVLQISGIDLPDSYKVEFSTVYTRNAIPAIGDASGVTIPNELLQRSAPITAYVVLYGENGGRNREYWITIYITPGQPPETITPDPEQADVIDQAIAALNSGVARTEAAATSAEGSARDAEAAAEAVQNLSVAAETLATGEPATVEKAVDPETGAVTLNFGLPRGVKGDPLTYEDLTPEQKAELVQGPILEAQDAAVTAVGNAKASAVDAVESAGTTQVNAVNQAGTTQTAAVNQAGTTQVAAVNQAGTTQVQAVTDKGAEVIGSIPSDYSTLADDVADLSRQLSDVETSLDTKAPVILETASGAIASFSDGADSMPIRKIVATIEPVQAAGTPSPENPLPISGWTGANLFQTYGDDCADYQHAVKWGTSSNPVNVTVNTETLSVQVATTRATTYEGARVPVTLKPNTMYAIDIEISSILSGTPYFGLRDVNSNTFVPSSYMLGIWHNRKRISSSELRNEKDLGKYTLIYMPIPSELASVADLALMCTWDTSDNGDITYKNITVRECTTLPITFTNPSTGDPMTVYGGTVTLNEDGSADVVSNKIAETYSDDRNFVVGTINGQSIFQCRRGVIAAGSKFISNLVSFTTSIYTQTPDNSAYFGSTYFNVKMTSITELSAFNALIHETPIQIVANLATPQTYHFPDIGSLLTYYGQNNVWIDTGAITECDYPADTKLFLTARDEEITGNIAPIENGTTAIKAYAQGAYFWHDTKFCKALTAIASGATFTLGTNYQETTVAAELLAAQN